MFKFCVVFLRCSDIFRIDCCFLVTFDQGVSGVCFLDVVVLCYSNKDVKSVYQRFQRGAV